ncbi:MAG: hypothetical protein JNN05_04360 [Candidatus Omnitrophica bacterium]|nr:hypothetical protein [Candidatus Omnitrophota bacterium]
MILQGGLPQPYVQFPEGCRVLDIPLPFDTKASFQAHAVPTSSTARAKFILQTAAEFKPDVFITEFFPFGRLAYMPELLPTIRYLRNREARIIASIGYPLIIDIERFENKKFSELYKAVFSAFDAFLIHSPKQLETRYIQETISSPALSQIHKQILKGLGKRLIYTGYVFPQPTTTGGTLIPIDKKSSTIIVSRGGGAVYPKIITTAIESMKFLDTKIRMILACGPATSSKEMELFRSCIQPSDKDRILLAGHLDNLDEHLRHCALSVSLCGYNTSVQLMRFGTPSVIIPYQNQNSPMPTNDQIARAQLFQEKFQSNILHHDTMTGKSLAQAVKDQLSQPRPKPAPESWFTGAEAAARFVVEGTLN